jgi:hypothetical protein
MEAEEDRRFSFEVWGAMAPGWERWRAQLEGALSPVRQWLVSELAPGPGAAVLELSADPGDTGFAAAAALGENGRLISTDFSPARLGSLVRGRTPSHRRDVLRPHGRGGRRGTQARVRRSQPR